MLYENREQDRQKPHPRKHTQQLGFLDFDIRLHRIDDHVWFRGSAREEFPGAT